MQEFKCYTVDEAAAILKLHRQTIRAHIRKGDIKAVKLGNRLRITDDEIKRLLDLNPQVSRS